MASGVLWFSELSKLAGRAFVRRARLADARRTTSAT